MITSRVCVRYILVAVLVLGFATAGICADKELSAPLVINVDEANPPLMYQQDGIARGIYPEILRTVFARLNVPVSIQTRPWPRALSEVDQNEAGLAGLYSNAERKAKYDFSEPIFVERLMVYLPTNEVSAFKGLKSLRGKRVGIIRGWSYGLAFDGARKRGLFDVRPNRNDAYNFALLNAKRIDALVAAEHAGQIELLRSRYKDIAAAPIPITEQTTYLAFNKRAKKTALLAQFDQIVADLKADGTLDKVIAKAIEVASPMR